MPSTQEEILSIYVILALITSRRWGSERLSHAVRGGKARQALSGGAGEHHLQ